MSTIKASEIDVNFGWGDEEPGGEVATDCLFPPQGAEKAQLAIKKLRELLDREYKMREWVFRQDPKKKAQKLREIQEAAQALRDIEEVLDELGGRSG